MFEEATEVIEEMLLGEPVTSTKLPSANISDDDLVGTRNNLFSLFDAYWPDLEFELERLRAPDEVRAALSCMKSDDSQYVIRLLLSEQYESCSRKELTQLRSRQKKLKDELNTLQAEIRTVSEELNDSLPPPQPEEPTPESSTKTSEFSQQELKMLKMRENRFRAKLEQLRKRNVELREEQKHLSDLLERKRAGYAKAELLKFCHSNLNRFNPRRMANAVAGLPFIGFRQSSMRCVKLEATKELGGYRYSLTRMIGRILYSWDRKSSLLVHFQFRLQHGPRSPIRLWKDLGNNWRLLRRAIEATENIPHSRACAITSEYLRLLSGPISRQEGALVREERIRVKLKNRRKKAGSPTVRADDKP